MMLTEVGRQQLQIQCDHTVSSIGGGQDATEESRWAFHTLNLNSGGVEEWLAAW
jgi:hypothetical protein